VCKAGQAITWVSAHTLWIFALQTVFAEQITPHKARDGCTQPTIGMYSIHTRSKQVYLNMGPRIFFFLKQRAMAHFIREVLSKCSILKSIVYALAVNDVADLQWRLVDGCESIHDTPGYFAHETVH
jgi:hypothetical protein